MKKFKKKNFCVVTSSRADYGIMSKFLKVLSKKHYAKIIVTGTHLSKKFGYTINEINKDNIKIYKKINIIPKSDKEVDISKTISKTIENFSNIFKKMKIDTLILLGDRYEIFACAVAASIHRIKIAHIHGGETTSNALDESFRHSITIMSHIHFVAAKKYYQRVIQLGKKKENVHLVGALSVSNIKEVNFNKKRNLIENYKLKNRKFNIFLVYHSETLEKNYGIIGLKNILKELKKLKKFNIYATLSNADTMHNKFRELLLKFESENNNFKVFNSLNYLDYLYILKNCKFLIGNSSSGIIEAPTLGVVTINVGNRQHGRLRANSIIDTSENQKNINKAIKKALKFKLKKFTNPYEQKNTTQKIIKVLEESVDKKLIGSKFFDIER
jgi:GDP/UDP-N,N'-diacetylbacillosamine 2-epimerase (hydrolysing)